MSDSSVLRVEELESGYGGKIVLRGVSLGVRAGEVVAVVGPNGAGKSTLLKTIFGLIRPWTGAVIFDGLPISGHAPRDNVERGLCYLPQGSRVFTELTVRENLEVGGYILRSSEAKERIDVVLAIFPSLVPKLRQVAGTLSGGERQMLALAGSLMLQPKLLLLDEPSLGLSPAAARAALATVVDAHRQMRNAVLVVEQNVREVFKLASRAYVLRLGKVVLSGKCEDLAGTDELHRAFLI